jgi:hypothetical protein
MAIVIEALIIDIGMSDITGSLGDADTKWRIPPTGVHGHSVQLYNNTSFQRSDIGLG